MDYKEFYDGDLISKVSVLDAIKATIEAIEEIEKNSLKRNILYAPAYELETYVSLMWPSANLYEIQWISVNDKLPEKGERVLVYCDCTKAEGNKIFVEKDICIGRLIDGVWFSSEAGILKDVIAWMQLPNSPK